MPQSAPEAPPPGPMKNKVAFMKASLNEGDEGFIAFIDEGDEGDEGFIAFIDEGDEGFIAFIR